MNSAIPEHPSGRICYGPEWSGFASFVYMAAGVQAKRKLLLTLWNQIRLQEFSLLSGNLVLISWVTSLPTPTPFKRTQIYIRIFHKQEHVPSRFVQIAEECSLWFRSWKYIFEWLHLRHSINKSSLTKPIPSCDCLSQRSNETELQQESMNIFMVMTFWKFFISCPFSPNLELNHLIHLSAGGHHLPILVVHQGTRKAHGPCALAGLTLSTRLLR